MQMALMEDKWTQMENGGSGAGYTNGKGELGGGNMGNQYMARMTQYYTEGNQVKGLNNSSTLLLHAPAWAEICAYRVSFLSYYYALACASLKWQCDHQACLPENLMSLKRIFIRIERKFGLICWWL